MIKVYKIVIVWRKQIKNYYVLVFIIWEWQGSTWSYKAENFKWPKRHVLVCWFFVGCFLMFFFFFGGGVVFPPIWLIISLWSSFFSKVVDPKMEKYTPVPLQSLKSTLFKSIRHDWEKISINSSCTWKPWAQKGCKPKARKGRKKQYNWGSNYQCLHHSHILSLTFLRFLNIISA